MHYLKLTLAAVLQSYGTGSTKWAEFHDTELFPTTSAVIGLIACACGLKKEDKEYSDISKCTFLCRSLNNTEKLTDYQIVAPREYKKSREKSAFWTNDGGHSGSQLPIYKSYLVNAEFEVYVGADSVDLLKKIHESFLNPKWAYYLGRACCTPSKPIVDTALTLLSENDIAKEKDIIKCIYT